MAAFREVYSCFGVDEGTSPPVMMVPLHGSNVVALEGGEGMKVRPEKGNVTVEKPTTRNRPISR